MKSKILFICCFILLLCGCSKKKTLKPKNFLQIMILVLQLSLKMVVGITKDSRINHINDYIGDQYIESKRIMIQFIIMILFKLL